MTASEILQRYIAFFEKRGHVRIPNSSLVPENDSTTLFTSSGMQPLIPFLLGETHPSGKRLVNVQNSFRAQDIEEIGDNRHTTFFRMLGNWSLGDYFKKEQIPWFFEFLTSSEEGVGLDPKKLYVTVFEGNDFVPKDEEAISIWTEIFTKAGLDPRSRIFEYPVEKNWWSRSGTPDKMPPGEPGGPDSEVFYEFDEIKHDVSFGEKCHVNCDCGRYLEIGNSVFMQFKKTEKGFEELPQKNVDFGGGLERLAAASINSPDVFLIDIFNPIISEIEKVSGAKYEDLNQQKSLRIIADHLKGATYLITQGVVPANKERGYVLRRLLRRAAVKMHQLKGGLTPIPGFQGICDQILGIEEDVDGSVNRVEHRDVVFTIVADELEKFGKSLDRGLKVLEKSEEITGKTAFDLYQTYGFPLEITMELYSQKGGVVNVDEFKTEFEKHRELSRSSSAGMFKGGLADHSEKTIMGHTATHLMHQALRDVLGNTVFQTGSNITPDRVRFDFSFDRKVTQEEIEKVEKIVNEKTKENIPVHFEILSLSRAKEIGAIGLFDDKYAENVKVYFIGGGGDNPKESYSKEFCGGPHVDFTGKIKKFKIIKEEGISKGSRRIYATVE